MRFATGVFVATLAVAVAIAATGAIGQTSAGQEYGLHPVCGAIRRANVNGRITNLTSQSSTELEVSCFSYALQPLAGASGEAGCATAPSRVVLEILDPTTGLGQSEDFSGIYQGSMYATAYRFNTPRIFRMYLDYPDFERCPKVMYVSLYAELTVRRRTDVEHPYVVGATPIVMFRGETYTIELRSPAPVPPVARGNILAVLIAATKSCRNDASAAYALPGAHNDALVWVNDTFAKWPVVAPTNGAFAICMRSSPSESWSVAAFVEAYGGNPAFFDSAEVTGSQSTRGSTTLEFTFFGHMLNARADSLVFVDSSLHTCGTTPRASRSATVGALSQRTPNSTTARVTFDRNAIYLVCYRTGATGEYVDVPNFDTMSRHVIQNTTDPNQQQENWANGVTSAPGSGSEADAGQQWLTSCTTAPVQPTADRVTTDELVRLILSASSLPGDFSNTIAELLCLPGPLNVSIAEVRGSTAMSSGLDVFVAILCPSNVCNGPERQQALIAAGQARRIPGVVSASAVEFDGINVRNANSDDKDDATSSILYIVVGVLIALVVALVVAIVLVARFRRTNPPNAPDADVIQGHVIEVQGAPAHPRRAAAHEATDAPNPYGDGASYHDTAPVAGAREVDMSPIPPPPEKPLATSTRPFEGDEEDEADQRELR